MLVLESMDVVVVGDDPAAGNDEDDDNNDGDVSNMPSRCANICIKRWYTSIVDMDMPIHSFYFDPQT